MLKTTMLLVACLLISAGELRAQSQPATLATLFQDVYGPNGLVLNSDDVQLDGSNHSAHFNSAFQSDFRLVNIALTSQLTAVPLPSPASGFTYKFDAATGTFVRSTTSFGPILADRAETIGRGRVAFGFTQQSFSFDHLDGVTLTAIPAVFRHDNFETGGGRADVVVDVEYDRGDREPVHRGADIRHHRSGRRVAGRANGADPALAPVERDDQPDRHRHQPAGPLLPRRPLDRRIWTSNQFVVEGSAAGLGDLLLRTKATLMMENTRAFAAGLDLRLPTGDELNLLGAGAAGIRPFAAFSPRSAGSIRTPTSRISGTAGACWPGTSGKV